MGDSSALYLKPAMELTKSPILLVFARLMVSRVYHETLPLWRLFSGAILREVVERTNARRFEAQRSTPGWVSVGVAWREAVAAFSTHGFSILLCAFAGFALPGILGAVLNAPSLEALLRNQSTLCTFLAPQSWLPLLVGALALLAHTLAMGVIAMTAFRRSSTQISPLRATLGRFPALLCGSLVYGAVICIAQAGLSLPLTALHLDPAQLRAGITLDHPRT